MIPRLQKGRGNLLLEESIVIDPSQVASKLALFPSVLELSEMVYNIPALLQAHSTDRADLLCVDKIVRQLMDMTKAIPHLLGSRAAACMHFL